MRRTVQIIGISIGLFLLILVRRFETFLFYDPLLLFFQQNYFNHQDVPEFNTVKLFLSLFFRFVLNSILTLLIIQLWFNDKKITVISIYILIAGFIFFASLYFLSLFTNFGLGHMPTFYIRRILIQPILLLLLILAIYYYKQSKANFQKNL
ncbi:MAG: exosortase F system-associated protein [Flavobacteriaceae bacterium]|nr:exosortase F system-associated protein [Flavobacteriaceae bacterium]